MDVSASIMERENNRQRAPERKSAREKSVCVCVCVRQVCVSDVGVRMCDGGEGRGEMVSECVLFSQPLPSH